MTAQRPYAIITDATVDLTPEIRGQVHVIAMQIQIGDDTLTNDADWDEARLSAFYERLRAGEMPTTSQITPYRYETEFERAVRAGEDVLYVCLSSGLSDTIDAAQLAARAVTERYPECTIEVVDSRSCTYIMATMIEAAIKNRAEGMRVYDNARWLEAHRNEFAAWFTVSDLMYLRHGGRISATAALLGSTFRVMPIMHIDEAGELPVIEKVQGRHRAIKQLAYRLEQGMNEQTGVIYIIHANAAEEAELLRSMARQILPDADVRVGHLGPVIGGHVGPGTLAVAFRGKSR